MGQRGLMPPLPTGAGAIVQARLQGMKPQLPVIVSFVGATPWQGEHVFPRPGQRHDWGWSEGLRVVIVTAPGLDPREAIRGTFWPLHLNATGYPTLIDIEREAVAAVVDVIPRIRLRHLHPGEYFTTQETD